MPTLVIFGARGQLGMALAQAPLPLGWDRILAARPEIDITDQNQVDQLMQGVESGLVVNAAAYTAVDKAETDADQAFAVNQGGAGLVAAAAAARDLAVLHISTDFVFDGRKATAYDEGDMPHPMSVYGASKRAGEIAVAGANPRHVILRTAWVFSAHAGCFPRTIFRLLRNQAEVGVVDDQFGCPTSAEQLATIIMTLAPRLAASPAGDAGFGLFHLGGLPAVSRFAFAQAVALEAEAQGIAVGKVVPRATLQAPGTAQRPANSALSSARLTSVHGVATPDWRDILPACVRAYAAIA